MSTPAERLAFLRDVRLFTAFAETDLVALGQRLRERPLRKNQVLFREGDPAGWVHATLRRGGMKLELRCIDPTHKYHGQVVDLKWRTA